MTWNYRVIDHDELKSRRYFAIHEVYYDERGIEKGVTENPIHLASDTVEELKQDITLIQRAFTKLPLKWSWVSKPLAERQAMDNIRPASGTKDHDAAPPCPRCGGVRYWSDYWTDELVAICVACRADVLAFTGSHEEESRSGMVRHGERRTRFGWQSVRASRRK